MRTTILRLADGIHVDSVVVEGGPETRHVYRIVGGSEDGREFDTLGAVARFIVAARLRWPSYH